MVGNLIVTKPTRDKLGMPVRSFIDTNILIYAEVSDDKPRQLAALALLKELHATSSGVLSTQVLKEYCNVAIKKLKLPLHHIREQLNLHEQFEVVQVTPTIIRAGLDLHQTRSVSFYDALICASAQTAGCSVLYSEDLNAGENINGVSIVNPFIQL
jgi:predicted nucleic acid-binding protein